MPNDFLRGIAADINEFKRSIGALVGIAEGLVCDGQLNDQEIAFLSQWLEENQLISNGWPGDVVYQRVREVLADGVVTDAERAYLLATLRDLIGGNSDKLASAGQVTKLGFDQVDKIEFGTSRFCLTGDFVFGPREACSAAIERRGGVVGSVTKKLRYLVVGSLGSPEWKHGSFGTKFEKAMQYKRDGAPILILSEDIWASSL